MKRRAFTFVELLCVIAILLSLASILLPVFPRAKFAAKSSVCVSNERELGMATEMYLTDNDDLYPYAINLIERTHPGLYAFLGRPKAMDPSKMSDNVQLLEPYVKGPGVWLCPVDSGRTFLDETAPAYPTLSLFNDGSSYFLADLVEGQSGTSWSNPSNQIYAVDGSPGWHGGQTYFTLRWNALYYDGHVKSQLLSVAKGISYTP